MSETNKMHRIGDNTLPCGSPSMAEEFASQITIFDAETSGFQNTSNQFIEFTSNSRLLGVLEQCIDPYGIEGLLEVIGYQGVTVFAHSHFLIFPFRHTQRPFCALVGLEVFCSSSFWLKFLKKLLSLTSNSLATFLRHSWRWLSADTLTVSCSLLHLASSEISLLNYPTASDCHSVFCLQCEDGHLYIGVLRNSSFWDGCCRYRETFPMFSKNADCIPVLRR